MKGPTVADYRIRIVVDPSGAASGSRKAEGEIGRVGDAADRANARVGGLMDELRGLGGALKVAAVIAAVTQYARITDEVKQANAQLRLATRTQQEMNRAQKEAYAIAQQNGTAYGATATLLAKNLKAANSLGLAGAAAAEKARAATSAVSAAIRVSGTSAEAANGSLIQLGQALASGVLRGDELNSVMEGIPAVADALAKAVGKSTGELRKMGAEGKLTSQFVLEGLAKAEPELAKLAAMIPMTFGGALEKVKNSFGQLVAGFDSGTSLSSGMIAALDLISRALDTLAQHSDAVANTIVGVMIAMSLKTVASFRASAAEAVKLASANLEVAAAANAAAIAQERAAAASLTGGTGAAAKKVAETTAALRAAEAAAASAGARASLFGNLVAKGAAVARAALALVGGPIGLIVTALAAVVLWAGKAALGFKPIGDEAGTVADYVAVAWEDATKWAGDKFAEFSAWAGKKFGDVGSYAKTYAAFVLDVWMNVARGIAAAVEGVVAAWKAGVDNVKRFVAGMASDASEAMKGNFTTKGMSDALANSTEIGRAFGNGVQHGFDNTFKGLTGEKVVNSVVDFAKSIPGRIETWAKGSGLRDRANARAKAREAAQQGGLGAPGTPPTPAGDKDKNKDKTTFADILKEAKEEAKLAAMSTAERERQTAIYAAQKTLKRDLTASEQQQLGAAIDLRRNNEANLALENATKDAVEGARKARMEAAAEAARMAGDYDGAARIEAEIAVQQVLNQAKRDGVVLDQEKLDAYKKATLEAARETEEIKRQQEAKRDLQEIADRARDSIRSAISDGIYDALNGKLSLGGLFKTFGNILKRQFAEQVTYAIFQGGQVNQSTVTSQALSIVTPSAEALAAATDRVTASLVPANDNNPIAGAMEDGAADVKTAAAQFTGTLSGAVAPLSEALRGLLQLFGLAGKGSLMGGGNQQATTGVGKFFSSSGPIAGLTNKLGKLVGLQDKVVNGKTVTAGSQFLQKAGQGAMIGSITGSVLKGLGVKTSSTGSMIGGALGSLTPLGPLGGVLGGALGGVLGGALKKVKWGAVTVGGGSTDGSLSVSGATGNSAAAKKAASGAGTNVMEILQQYADQLGAGLGNVSGITIGQRHGDWRVNTSGTSLKIKKGAVEFDDDAQGAIAYAVQVAIERGVFTGLSSGVSNALKSGSASVDEAVSFLATQKSINYQAQSITDPVGAQIAQLDDEFNALRAQYKKFGEDTANLEKVYQDKRAQIIADATSNELNVLKSFRDELKGTDLGGKSLTEQVAYQDSLLKNIEAAKAAGQTVNPDELNSVGRALLDATQQLEGNTPAYYAQVDRIMALLNSVIGDTGGDNVVPITDGATGATVDTTPIVSAANDTTAAVNSQTEQLVNSNNQLGAAIVRMQETIANRIDSLVVSRDNGLGFYRVEDFR